MIHVAIVTSLVLRCREYIHNFRSAQRDNACNKDLIRVEGTDGHVSILFGTRAKQFPTEV